jgi:hypothetical protein
VRLDYTFSIFDDAFGFYLDVLFLTTQYLPNSPHPYNGFKLLSKSIRSFTTIA